MKILHYNVFKNVPVGVRNQLLDEEKAMAKMDGWVDWEIAVSCMCDWDVAFRTPLRSVNSNGLISDNLFYRDAYRWLKDVAPDYDRILVRYRTANPWQALVIRGLDDLYTVHHAIEEDEAGAGKGVKSCVERWIEKVVGPYSLGNVDGIIALTPEILSYETGRARSSVNACVYPNGIFLQDMVVVPDERKGNLKFLFVGSLNAPWHGLDVVVDGLLSADPNVEIHVVGPSTDVSHNYSRQIVFHGELPRAGIVEVAKVCDAGLGTFALGKKGMSQACTLKVREYLSIGLPVVSGAIDSGLPEAFSYYITKTDATGWSSITEKVLKWRGSSRKEVRDASSAYIDKQLIMERLLKWLEPVGSSASDAG